MCLAAMTFVTIIFLSITGCKISKDNTEVYIDSFDCIRLGGSRLEFVKIPGEKTWFAKTEVSNKQYREYLSSHSSGDFEGVSLDVDDYPVVNVSFKDAMSYCRWLNSKYSQYLPGGTTIRLPTSSEWEVAARSGENNRVYPWGNSLPPNRGNYADKTFVEAFSHLPATGLYAPRSPYVKQYNDGHAVAARVHEACVNEWGLHGVGANVKEFTMDHSTIWTAFGPAAAVVIKGQSWAGGGIPEDYEVAQSTLAPLNGKGPDLGIRLVIGGKLR